MKLTHPALNTVLEFNNAKVNTLVIENQELFLDLTEELHRACEGMETDFVISLKNKVQPMAKSVEMLADFWCFDINKKQLLTKLCARLEQVALDEQHYLAANKLLADIERAISDWAFEFPCDVFAAKLSVGALLRASGVELRQDNKEMSLAEKLLDYMELVREFDRDKLFVYVNLRSFIDDEILNSFLETALAHEYRLLLLDSSEHMLLPMESRIVIDKDMCEI